ncbi:MAG: hypothetical protein NTW21_25605 [Verrucomicrobia bacterium]|nr:hypothetical protein [Verrucomicrobiota bacterium]
MNNHEKIFSVVSVVCFPGFPAIPQFLIPAENELAPVGVSNEFANHPRMGSRVAEVPLRCQVLLIFEH